MTFHIVRMDEKLEKIALNYQLDVEEIKANNKYIKDWNHLIPGTKLRLPEISNVLNDELDNYEPFIEEYYPKLSNNYNYDAEEHVKPIIDETVQKVSAEEKGQTQKLVLPQNTGYPQYSYYYQYPYYYSNRYYKKTKK